MPVGVGERREIGAGWLSSCYKGVFHAFSRARGTKKETSACSQMDQSSQLSLLSGSFCAGASAEAGPRVGHLVVTCGDLCLHDDRSLKRGNGSVLWTLSSPATQDRREGQANMKDVLAGSVRVDTVKTNSEGRTRRNPRRAGRRNKVQRS